jgi:hypothetical protein
MKSYVKPLTKQLTIAAIFLSFVTVVSFGIRQVRFSLHRARTIENLVVADVAPDHGPADSHTVDAEPKPQHANQADGQIEDEPDLQPVNTSDVYKEKPSKDRTKAKSFKGDYAKSKDAKGLEKVSLSGYENLYRTAEGQLWYVSKQPDGKTVKMQVYIDNATGEVAIVDAKSPEGSKGLEKVALSDYENLYITDKGEQWYVTEQPDGSVSKMQVQINDTTGDVTVVDVVK